MLLALHLWPTGSERVPRKFPPNKNLTVFSMHRNFSKWIFQTRNVTIFMEGYITLTLIHAWRMCVNAWYKTACCFELDWSSDRMFLENNRKSKSEFTFTSILCQVFLHVTFHLITKILWSVILNFTWIEKISDVVRFR
jgi:hypothetical protein